MIFLFFIFFFYFFNLYFNHWHKNYGTGSIGLCRCMMLLILCCVLLACSFSLLLCWLIFSFLLFLRRLGQSSGKAEVWTSFPLRFPVNWLLSVCCVCVCVPFVQFFVICVCRVVYGWMSFLFIILFSLFFLYFSDICCFYLCC